MTSKRKDITEMYLKEMTAEFEGLDLDDINFEHRRYIEYGDTESRDKLVLRAAPMVVALTRRLHIPRDFRDDAIQAGNLAVIQAVDTWRNERGFTFTTWASWKAARDMVREVEFLAGNALSMDLATIEWLTMMDDVADNVDNQSTLEFAKGVSLQIPTSNQGNEDMEAAVLSEQLREALLRLTRKQQRVILLVLEGKTFTQVADSLGISRQAVSEVYSRCCEVLKSFLQPDLALLRGRRDY